MGELKQVQTIGLNEFMESKEREILDFAKKNAEEVVKKELALMDFELVMAVNLTKKKAESLTKYSRKLRSETQKELVAKFDGDYDKISNFLENV